MRKKQPGEKATAKINLEHYLRWAAGWKQDELMVDKFIKIFKGLMLTAKTWEVRRLHFSSV